MSLAGLLFVLVSPALQDTLYVRGELVHTAAGPAIENGVVVCEGGQITTVGPAASVAIPDGATVLEAAVVTPGLIDARSVVGLSGILNQNHDQDQLERSAPLQPELRAIDAYNAREPLVAWLRSFGVTTVHTGHAPGAVITGQTLIAKTRGDSVDAAVFVPFAMVAATIGEGATVDGGKAPGTRSKAVAMLRQELVKAGEYATKLAAGGDKAPDRNLRLEALASVLAGERPLLVTAHRAHDIAAALRVQAEFDFPLSSTSCARPRSPSSCTRRWCARAARS
jgi:imidazolonepropionase-like amidohydrolase